MSLAIFSSLNACLTHYGTGPAPIYYGAGYTDLKTWWGIGPFYWKMLGVF